MECYSAIENKKKPTTDTMQQPDWLSNALYWAKEAEEVHNTELHF